MKTSFALLALLLLTTVAVTQETEEAPAGPPMDAGREISAAYPFEPNYVEVLDSRMHYVDVGEGDPILFLHGNPTSSYLWRNVIPHLSDQARCIAPDLIGMGKSGKPDIEYTFFDHAAYLDAFIEKLGLENITLVIHDWGSGLGFHYARRHPENVKAIAFMEGMVKPFDSVDAFPPPVNMMFKQFRTPEVGWKMLVDQNMFIEQLLPGGVARGLRPEEMEHYRAPFAKPEDRKPVWQWPNQVPMGGEPAEVVEAVQAYSEWLMETDTPMVLFTVEPGVLIPAETVAWCKEHIDNLQVIALGEGTHYIQEDYPHTIGQALAKWYHGLE